MNLPSNIYTQWYWRLTFTPVHFISLRADSHAQYEIRAYAEAIGRIVSQWVPTAWRAFEDYDLNGVHLSRAQMTAYAECCGARGHRRNFRDVAPGMDGTSDRHHR